MHRPPALLTIALRQVVRGVKVCHFALLSYFIVMAFIQRSALVALFALITIMSAHAAPPSVKEQVWSAEVSFARTMSERNIKAFAEFVSEEAVFFAGTNALRGRSAVVEGWTKFFSGPNPPFSWEPDQVEVLESGTLALSTGPVRDPTGKVIARFNSIWRLEAGGVWRVVFDKGSPPSPGPQ
jgi:ketosteroid isomerase-like protein